MNEAEHTPREQRISSMSAAAGASAAVGRLWCDAEFQVLISFRAAGTWTIVHSPLIAER
jgi:hypothetical protein